MSLPAGITPGLAFLPNWLLDAKDDVAFDALLSGWVRASSLRVAGVVWPADGKPSLMIQARPDGTETLAHGPAELTDVARALRGGHATIVWQTPQGSGRLYTLLQSQGRSAGLLWIEKTTNEGWNEADRAHLVLSARLIERSPALQQRLGPQLDPTRLNQRLQDASVIAGRMAHDFDNILTGIIGFADLSVPLVQAGSQAAKFLGEISKVGQRGIVFTQQLHQMSRSGHAKPIAGNVAAVLAKEENRLRSAMPSGVYVVSDIPNGLLPVGIEAVPLGSIIGHVLENALEASPPQSRVTVSAKLAELNPSDAKAYLGQVGPGTHVEVTVQDQGPGIRPDVRAKLFVEPFYTTKVRHRGLGLAIVYRTLYAHGGGIRIDSATAPDTGTVVRIVLPLAVARPTVTTTSSRPAGATTIGV